MLTAGVNPQPPAEAAPAAAAGAGTGAAPAPAAAAGAAELLNPYTLGDDEHLPEVMMRRRRSYKLVPPWPLKKVQTAFSLEPRRLD